MHPVPVEQCILGSSWILSVVRDPPDCSILVLERFNEPASSALDRFAPYSWKNIALSSLSSSASKVNLFALTGLFSTVLESPVQEIRGSDSYLLRSA